MKKDKKFWDDTLYMAAMFHDNYFGKKEPVNENELYIVKISKSEILSMDYTQIQGLIAMKMKTKDEARDNFQKIKIAINGYNDEKKNCIKCANLRNILDI